MKKIIFSMVMAGTLALLVTACNSKTRASDDLSTVDTTGLAQFQAMKEKQMVVVQSVPAKATVSNSSTAANSSGSMSSSSTHEAKTKKGWSKAAKYSVIGGGAGAILGAVINKKNRVAGGVIGGVIGGGVGYGIGRSQDKKDGRVQ